MLSSFGLICSFLAASLGLAAADRVGYPAVAVASVLLVALGVLVGLGHQRRFRVGPNRPTEPAAQPGRGARLTVRLPPLAVRPIRPPMCQVSALTRG